MFLFIKNKFVILTLFIIILICFSCLKKESEDTTVILTKSSKIIANTVSQNYGVGVVNTDRLRFRSLNDLHSKTLRYLDRGIIVVILSRDKYRVKINEIEDYWYNIEFEGIKGWVFGYYLDIYSSYDDAKFGASKYLKEEISESQTLYYEDSVNKNLFFLANGKLHQVINGKTGEALIIKTQQGLYVTNFYFTKNINKIYYLAENPKSNNNQNYLYLYNVETGENSLISKNINSIVINQEQNRGILLSIENDKENKSDYWVLNLYNFEDDIVVKEIVRIEKTTDYEIKNEDTFLKTLNRELGSLIHLEWDKMKNFIYFKPPEENQTYLISISNSSYTKIDLEKSNVFDIDSSRYIKIYSDENQTGNSIYNMVLKDRITGIEKTIIQSEYYPINFALSPRKAYIAITMVSTNEIINNYYHSSIYVLSLSSYSLIPISTDGVSYHPKWSFVFQK